LLFKSLNEVLSAELICALRRRIRQESAPESADGGGTETVGVRARADFELADRLAERISELGGYPELALENLGVADHGELGNHISMSERIYGDLVAERAAAVTQRRLLIRLHNSDPETSALLRDLLVRGEAHVNHLSELRRSHQEWVAYGEWCLS